MSLLSIVSLKRECLKVQVKQRIKTIHVSMQAVKGCVITSVYDLCTSTIITKNVFTLDTNYISTMIKLQVGKVHIR